MTEFVLGYECALCPKKFTTQKYAEWHIRVTHVRSEIEPIKLRENITVKLEKGPGINGITVAYCPRHNLICIGMKSRHKCHAQLFLCEMGCGFCRKCGIYVDKVKKELPSSMVKSWKKITRKPDQDIEQ